MARAVVRAPVVVRAVVVWTTVARGGGGAGGGASDAGPDDAGSPVDAGLGNGAPCSADSACASAFCGPLADGGRGCSGACSNNSECGGDLWRCSPDDGGVNRCWPRLNNLCRPCVADPDCAAGSDPRDVAASDSRCVRDSQTGSSAGAFCGVSCASQNCPPGYTCSTIDGGSPQCVRATGECGCDPGWGASATTCWNQGTEGSCLGARVCVDGGLTACSAQVPAAEACNGADDDCDGTVDENGAALCTDGLSCTSDTCPGDGGACQRVVDAASCLIGGSAGACVDAGALAPAGACEQCAPGTSQTNWTAFPGCTIGGVCFPALATNPLSSCQVCDPSRSTTAWSTATDACLISGVCYTSNQVNPAQLCEACDPLTSQTAWTARSSAVVCNAADACFNAATCSAGTCPARVLTQDGNESNNTPTTATSMSPPTTTNCNADQRSASGRLSGSATRTGTGCNSTTTPPVPPIPG